MHEEKQLRDSDIVSKELIHHDRHSGERILGCGDQDKNATSSTESTGWLGLRYAQGHVERIVASRRE